MKPYKERIEGMTRQYEEFLTSLYEQGYKDGQANFKEDRKESDQDYKDGLADGRMEVWSLVKTLYNLSLNERDRLFCPHYLIIDIIDNYSPEEAIKNVKEWEEKQKKDDKIKVGDEVEDETKTCIVLSFDGENYANVIYRYKNDDLCNHVGGIKLEKYTKTGRHFPQVVELLKQMKGEE